MSEFMAGVRAAYEAARAVRVQVTVGGVVYEVPPSDHLLYLNAIHDVDTRLQDDKLFERIQREAAPLPNDVVD